MEMHELMFYELEILTRDMLQVLHLLGTSISDYMLGSALSSLAQVFTQVWLWLYIIYIYIFTFAVLFQLFSATTVSFSAEQLHYKRKKRYSIIYILHRFFSCSTSSNDVNFFVRNFQWLQGSRLYNSVLCPNLCTAYTTCAMKLFGAYVFKGEKNIFYGFSSFNNF